jgi:hypothetical protein
VTLARLRRYFLDPAGAEVAIEFCSTAVVAARVERKRGRTELRALASEPLQEGVFAPALDNPGFVGREAMRDAVKRALARVGAAAQVRTAIVVPDVLARFRLFAQDEVQAEASKRDAAVSFRMQRLLPFSQADARVVTAWPRSVSEPVIAIGFSAAVLGAYEQVGEAFGLDVGSVETSSMALAKGLAPGGDVLLVRHDLRWLTLSLLRNGWPVSIRSFDVDLARSEEEVCREIASTAVFWRDRLNGASLAGAFIHSTDDWFDRLGASVRSDFGAPSQRVGGPAHLLVAGVPAAVARQGAPALTLLGVS